MPEIKEGKDIDARLNNLEKLLEQSQIRISELEKESEQRRLTIVTLEYKNKKLERKISKMVKKDDLDVLEQRISTLKRKNEKLERKISKMIEQEQCRRFVFVLKDLSSYKNIADILKNNGKLDHFQRRIILERHGKMRGIEKEKREGINGLCDSKNWNGHAEIGTGSVDECLSILCQYPNIAHFYNVKNCPLDITVDFLESCRGAVEAIESFIMLHHAELIEDPKAVLGEKTTLLEKNQKRNLRRTESMQRKQNEEQQQNA